jgi:uncharacterized membrane protein
MDLESIVDLPAHPLVVHAAVVLLPLAAIGTLVVAAVPRARRHYAPLALAAALAATVAVGLAQTSGEALEDQVRETDLVEQHTDQGESVLPWAVAVTVAAGAVTAASRRDPSQGTGVRRGLATTALMAVSLVAGIGATWSVVDVGHSGAKATWTTVQDTDTGDDD